MKRIVFLTTLVLAAVLIGTGTLSVSAKGRKPAPEPIPVTYIEQQVCEVGTFDLWAGQDIWAGTVYIYLDEDGYLQVEIESDYTIDEVHLGTYDELPTRRPAPGQMEFNPGPYEVDDMVIVVVHVAFADDMDPENPVAGETAYAGYKPGPGPAWWYFVALKFIPCEEDPDPDPDPECSCETTYAHFGDASIPFDVNGQPWGWYAEFMAGEFPLYAGAGLNDLSKGTHVGTIFVSEDGTVTYELFEGFEVNMEDDEPEIHFYIGEAIPERIPGQWNTIEEPFMYMTFHLVVCGEYDHTEE